MKATDWALAGLGAAGAVMSAVGLIQAKGPRKAGCKLPPNVLMIAAPFIDTAVATSFLYALDQSKDPQTVILHTGGGLAVACAQIADAMLKRDTTVVVPYMAYSGGTLIALCAKRLMMGEFAALTPVDPMMGERRAIHNNDFTSAWERRNAEEYLNAMTALVERMLFLRLPDKQNLLDVRSFLLGHKTPHGWPASREQISAMGFAVEAAAPSWGQLLCFLTEP